MGKKDLDEKCEKKKEGKKKGKNHMGDMMSK